PRRRPAVTNDPLEAGDFYDALAPYYDLIFDDWDASMARQGAALAALIDAELGSGAEPASVRILDAASGIGTQALALAARGFRVTPQSGRCGVPAGTFRASVLPRVS